MIKESYVLFFFCYLKIVGYCGFVVVVFVLFVVMCVILKESVFDCDVVWYLVDMFELYDVGGSLFVLVELVCIFGLFG